MSAEIGIDSSGVVRAIRNATQTVDEPISLHEPHFAGNEWQYVKDCLDSGWVSSVGAYVDRFEDMLQEFTAAQGVIAAVNGTAALHLCLVLSDVEANDEVILPSFSFVATANAVSYCGAVPHFVDVDEHTLGLNPNRLESYLAEISEMKNGVCVNKRTGRVIKAVIPMHTFGHPVALDEMAEICRRFGLCMVEDAAESLGSFYQGRHTGLWGHCAALSFNGNKTLTTGGGGAILTSSWQLAQRAKHLTTTAKRSHRWEFFHDALGYNYRLPNLNAALGCAQMEQLESFLGKKRRLAERYRESFSQVAGVNLFTEPDGCKSNYWLNALIIEPEIAGCRDELLAELNEQGIMARPAWSPLHRLPMYDACPRDELPVTGLFERCLINIPSSPFLGGADA